MSEKRYRVDYDLAYDGGGGTWHKGYRTKWGAHIARLWNLHVASWGGSAVLSSFEERLGSRADAEHVLYQSDPVGYVRGLSKGVL